jgi:hypothetical protein
MSPKLLVVSPTYKTRVAVERHRKKRQGIVIGQLTGHPIPSAETQKGGLSLISVFIEILAGRREGSLLGGDPWRGSLQRESLQAIRFCLSHFLGTIATRALTGQRLATNRSFAAVRSVCAIRSSAMADGVNKLMTRATTGLRLAVASARGAKKPSLSFPFFPCPILITV